MPERVVEINPDELKNPVRKLNSMMPANALRGQNSMYQIS